MLVTGLIKHTVWAYNTLLFKIEHQSIHDSKALISLSKINLPVVTNL